MRSHAGAGASSTEAFGRLHSSSLALEVGKKTGRVSAQASPACARGVWMRLADGM